MKHSFTIKPEQEQEQEVLLATVTEKSAFAEEGEEEFVKKIESIRRRQRVFSCEDAIKAAKMLINTDDSDQSWRQDHTGCCVGLKHDHNNKNNCYVNHIKAMSQNGAWDTVLTDKPKMLEMHAF